MRKLWEKIKGISYWYLLIPVAVVGVVTVFRLLAREAFGLRGPSVGMSRRQGEREHESAESQLGQGLAAIDNEVESAIKHGEEKYR